MFSKKARPYWKISDQISLKETKNWTSSPLGSHHLYGILHDRDCKVKQEHMSTFPSLLDHGISFYFYILFCFDLDIH